MIQWYKNVQEIINKIDECIKDEKNDELTLKALSEMVGYSKFHTSRMFNEISGMTLKEYIYKRKLAFSVKELRDTQKSILNIGKFDIKLESIDNCDIKIPVNSKVAIELTLKEYIEVGDHYLYICNVDNVYADPNKKALFAWNGYSKIKIAE